MASERASADAATPAAADSHSAPTAEPSLKEALANWNATAAPPKSVAHGMVGVRTDAELRRELTNSRDKTVVVEFGSTWCTHCAAVFPHFLRLSRQHPQNKYVLAQVDYMDAEAKDVTHTPTFAVYNKGRKVDDFYGVDVQRLEDHLWLHSEAG